MANRETREVHIKITSNERGMQTANKQTSKLSGGLKGVAASANLAAGGIKAMTMALLSSGVGAIVVALGGMVAFMGKTMGVAKNFSTELGKLKGITGATAEEILLLKNNAKQLGETTNFTATEVLKAQQEFAKLGFKTQEILEATGPALLLASAASTDLSTAAMTAKATMNQFGLDASQTGRVIDVMAMSFSNSSLDISKFQSGMANFGPVAHQLGLNVEEATAMLAQLTDQGIDAGSSGTHLRKIAADLGQEYGGTFKENLQKYATELANVTDENDRVAMAQKIVGERAYGSLNAIAGNVEQYELLKNQLDGASEAYGGIGAAQKMYNDATDNLQGDLDIMSSAFEGFMLGIEDGDGIFTKIARGGVQLLTGAIKVLGGVIQLTSLFFGNAFEKMKANVVLGFYIITDTFTRIGLNISKFVNEAKIALADIPIIGKGIDKEKAQQNIKDIEARLKEGNEKIVEATKNAIDADIKLQNTWSDFKKKRAAQEKAVKDKKEAEETKEAREAAAKRQKELSEEEQKALEKKNDYLKSLKKQEEDNEAKDHLAKLELQRKREIEKMEESVKNETDRQEAIERINKLYADKKEAYEKEQQEKKDKEKTAKDAKELKEAQDKKEKEFEQLIKDIEQENLNFENKRIRLQEQEALILQDKTLSEEQKTELIAKNKEAKENLEDEFVEYKAKADKRLIQGFMRLGQALGQETAVGKAIAIASTGYQTYKNAIKARDTQLALGTPGAPVRAAVAAGVEVAQGMMAIKKMTAIKVPNAGGVASPSISGLGGAGGAQAPSFNVIGRGSTDANIVAGAIGQSGQTPVQAYVVESQMTSQQQMSRNVSENASL